MIHLIDYLFKQVFQFSQFKVYPIEHFRLFIEEIRQLLNMELKSQGKSVCLSNPEFRMFKLRLIWQVNPYIIRI